MEKFPTVHDLLHDPTLCFSEFCLITNALKEGQSEYEILGMPELIHLQVTAGTDSQKNRSPAPDGQASQTPTASQKEDPGITSPGPLFSV